jgi:hypothetical protein
MGESWINRKLRLQVAERATYRCEYCQIAESDTFFGCEVDHIISEKHGGPSTLENLAYSCATCNRAKGTDIAGLDDDGKIAPLFNPRTDIWLHHFRRDGPLIIPLTSKSQATVRLLRLNAPERQDERI